MRAVGLVVLVVFKTGDRVGRRDWAAANGPVNKLAVLGAYDMLSLDVESLGELRCEHEGGRAKSKGRGCASDSHWLWATTAHSTLSTCVWTVDPGAAATKSPSRIHSAVSSRTSCRPKRTIFCRRSVGSARAARLPAPGPHWARTRTHDSFAGWSQSATLKLQYYATRPLVSRGVPLAISLLLLCVAATSPGAEPPPIVAVFEIEDATHQLKPDAVRQLQKKAT